MRISTTEQFEAWLDENGFLEDATVESLRPMPPSRSGETAAEPVCLTLSLQVEGSLWAGEYRTIRRLELAARGVEEYVLEGEFFPENCSQGGELITAASAPIAFEIDVPGRLRLACCFLDVDTTEHQEVVPPWLSNEFSATVRGQTLPTPQDWVEICSAHGLDVAWRNYGGPGVRPSEVPAEYDGWFLQFRNRISTTLNGLFVRYVERAPDGFTITFENHELEEARLWRAVALFLGGFPHCTVNCGNMRRTGPEWIAAVLDDLRSSTDGS